MFLLRVPCPWPLYSMSDTSLRLRRQRLMKLRVAIRRAEGDGNDEVFEPGTETSTHLKRQLTAAIYRPRTHLATVSDEEKG